jgi:hypothetical protein
LSIDFFRTRTDAGIDERFEGGGGEPGYDGELTFLEDSFAYPFKY